MKDIGLVLRTEIEKRKLKQTELSLKTGYSHSHLWQLLQKEDWTCSKLERVCEAIGISPMSVFDVGGELAEPIEEKVSVNSDDIKALKTLLKEKQKRIEALEEALASTKELLSIYRDKNGSELA